MLSLTVIVLPASAVSPTPKLLMLTGASKVMSLVACRITLALAVLMAEADMNASSGGSSNNNMVLVVLPSESTTVISIGSSNKVPTSPLKAAVST